MQVSPLTTGYLPAPGSQTLSLPCTVTNTATRLGTLITIPTLPVSTSPLITRPPNHVIFTIPSTANSSIWITWDNNTAPVIGSTTGFEMIPGLSYAFENCGPTLLAPGSGTTYPVNAATAFQLISSQPTTAIAVNFSD